MPELILEIRSVSKDINEVPILQDVNLQLFKGELCVLLGENGAGKSSLVRLLDGTWRKDSGTILMNGHEIDPDTPKDSRKFGIFTVQQESQVFEHLTAAENIFISNAPHSFIIRDKRKLNEMAQKVLDDLGFPIKSTQKARELNLAKRRMIEIARIAVTQAEILILDEPTTSLSEWESHSLLRLLREFKRKGGSILYVTQNFEHIMQDTDRVAIMRDGSIVNSVPVGGVTSDSIEKMIWGQYFPDKYPKLAIPRGPEIFCVDNLSDSKLLKNISFSLFQGEILGITGLVGSGRSQLAKTLFGLYPATNGCFYVDRLKAKISSPSEAIQLGIAYVTEDRCGDGLFMNLSAMDNAFVLEESVKGKIHMKNKEATALYKKYEKRVNIRVKSPKSKLFGLSGGTQQKLLLLRWFLSDARIFIFDEPTRGVDIASKVDIYNLMNDLVRKKSAVILISSSFDELVGMCDRILVLRDGTITYEARRSKPGDYDKLYRHAVHDSREILDN